MTDKNRWMEGASDADKNAEVYTQEHRFVKENVEIKNGRFSAISGEVSKDTEVVEAEGLYMVPGLVDIHFHGCMGADMCDGTVEALDMISAYEASVGVTSICPATMTIPKDELLAVMKNAGAYSYRGGAKLAGINMEGPFISPAKKAHRRQKISCPVIMNISAGFRRPREA